MMNKKILIALVLFFYNIPLLKVKTETYVMKVTTANDLLQQH